MFTCIVFTLWCINMTKNTSLYCNSGAGDQLYNDDIKRNGLHYIHNFRWIADDFIYFSNKYWVKWASSCNLFAMIYSGRGIWRRLPRYWCGVRQPIYIASGSLTHSFIRVQSSVRCNGFFVLNFFLILKLFYAFSAYKCTRYH